MSLRREENPMSAEVRAALEQRDILDAYLERPPYQRNDYLGWIGRAKREETRAKRVAQMLDELEAGDRYMKMKWSGPR
ncbi:MAG: YdeI/OmpD-associated family protein [Planctomycetota bacterium]|nr:YdeI/OmpD-associated family protein [Planctomycetota bacterium]